MTNDKKIKELFQSQRKDIPDDGFSDRIIHRLPGKKTILPPLIMLMCMAAGLILTISIQGLTPLIDQISDLVTAITHLQLPTVTSVVAYLGGIAILGTISYVMVKTVDER